MQEDDSPPPRRTWTRALAILAHLAALPTLLAPLGAVFWPFELATHFRLQYVLALLPLSIGLLLTRRWRQAVLPVVALVWNLAWVVPLFLPPAPVEGLPGTRGVRSAPRRSYRVMSLNVLKTSRDFEAVLAAVRGADPDLVVLIETEGPWLDALAILEREYPHGRMVWGLGIYSRFPLEDLRIERFAGGPEPCVFARVRVDDRSLELVGMHPLPPMRRELWRAHGRQLRAVADLLAPVEGPVLLLGDLNDTLWTPRGRELLERTGLRDSRQGFGVQPTWPGRLAPLGIAIDHILVSEEIEVFDRRVGDYVGSDHRAVILDFALR